MRTDLANDEAMKDTAFEVAKIARAAYCVRGFVPEVSDDEDDDERENITCSDALGDVPEAERADIKGMVAASQGRPL